MTKEEQIEKMAKDIAGIEQQEDLTLGEVYGIEATFELAEILCDAGYRKSDEVRKETAREVISWILNHIDVYAYFDQIMNFFAEKYDNDGVKVVEDERE